MYPTVQQATYEMRTKEAEFARELRRARQTSGKSGYELNQLMERIRTLFKVRRLPLATQLKTQVKTQVKAEWGF